MLQRIRSLCFFFQFAQDFVFVWWTGHPELCSLNMVAPLCFVHTATDSEWNALNWEASSVLPVSAAHAFRVIMRGVTSCVQSTISLSVIKLNSFSKQRSPPLLLILLCISLARTLSLPLYIARRLQLPLTPLWPFLLFPLFKSPSHLLKTNTLASPALSLSALPPPPPLLDTPIPSPASVSVLLCGLKVHRLVQDQVINCTIAGGTIL